MSDDYPGHAFTVVFKTGQRDVPSGQVRFTLPSGREITLADFVREVKEDFAQKDKLLARAREALDRLEIEMRPALSPDGHCYWVVRATHGQAEFIRKVHKELKNAHKD